MNDVKMPKFSIALDSCVLISLMGESENIVEKIKHAFNEKNTKIVLYRVVLNEIIGNGKTSKIRHRLSELFNCVIEIVPISEYEIQIAKEMSEIHKIIHRGDDQILAISKTRNDIVITFDKKLIRTCNLLGIKFFNPFYQDDF